METKDKKDVVNYIIETHDDNSGVPVDNGWDEIYCEDSLDKAKAEYERQLATHDTPKTCTRNTHNYNAIL